MTPREELIEYLGRAIIRIKQVFARMDAERETPEYKEKMKHAQEEDERRNQGFAERGENWRDIHIA